MNNKSEVNGVTNHTRCWGRHNAVICGQLHEQLEMHRRADSFSKDDPLVVSTDPPDSCTAVFRSEEPAK